MPRQHEPRTPGGGRAASGHRDECCALSVASTGTDAPPHRRTVRTREGVQRRPRTGPAILAAVAGHHARAHRPRRRSCRAPAIATPRRSSSSARPSNPRDGATGSGRRAASAALAGRHGVVRRWVPTCRAQVRAARQPACHATERAQSNSRHRAGSGPARGTEPTTSTERAAGRRVVCASLRTSLTDYSRGSAPVTSTSNCGTARHGTARHGGAAGARGTRSPRRTAECCASGLEPRASRREHQLGRLEAHSADDRAWPGSSTPGWMQADRR
jgi:hypothetical protein